MIINILITIIILGIIAYFCYINYKKCKNDLEKTLYILLFLVSMVPIAIYYLDRYNVPTYLGWNINVNSQNWLAFLANYSAGIISSVISAVVLVIVTILQIKKNNEDNSYHFIDNRYFWYFISHPKSTSTEYADIKIFVRYRE